MLPRLFLKYQRAGIAINPVHLFAIDSAAGRYADLILRRPADNRFLTAVIVGRRRISREKIARQLQPRADARDVNRVQLIRRTENDERNPRTVRRKSEIAENLEPVRKYHAQVVGVLRNRQHRRIAREPCPIAVFRRNVRETVLALGPLKNSAVIRVVERRYRRRGVNNAALLPNNIVPLEIQRRLNRGRRHQRGQRCRLRIDRHHFRHHAASRQSKQRQPNPKKPDSEDLSAHFSTPFVSLRLESFNNLVPVAVDDPRPIVNRLADRVLPVQVDMPMQVKLRLERFQEPTERLKADMRRIVRVMNLVRRRMRREDI